MSRARGIQDRSNPLQQHRSCKRLLDERQAGLKQPVLADSLVVMAGHVEHTKLRVLLMTDLGQLASAHMRHDRRQSEAS